MLRRAARAMGRWLMPPAPVPLMSQIIRRDARSGTFFRAIEYLNFERVEGDIVECGVFGGVSLAMLAKGQTFDPKGMTRRVVGFDTFQGLPASGEAHARWQAGDCAHAFEGHPLAVAGEPVTAGLVRRLFTACELEPPVLYEGRFDAVMPGVIPSVHPAIALLHVDCDLYESTRDVFAAAAPALQDGTVVLFDDWYHYKANPRMGEARAFHEFLAAHPEWEAVHWTSYATFCNAFMLVRR
jgi:O-methyltransferase